MQLIGERNMTAPLATTWEASSERCTRRIRMAALVMAPVLLAASAFAPSAHAESASQGGSVVRESSQRVAVEHVRITTTKPFAQVKSAIESKLQRYNERAATMLRTGDPEGARKELERIASPSGLMIVQSLDPGIALVLRGGARNSMEYGIGNVLTATEMTQYRMGAGLYAPIRVLVYEDEGGGTVIEYDRPSSQFGIFGSKQVDAVAARLDSQLNSVLGDVTK